jgi:glycosyltransferase involved in cell wall biosynthesis
MLRSMASVSAVVPAHNAEETVGESLASVLSQTSPVEQVIVVDDGSTDGTAEAARAVDPSITVISTANQGVSAARNRGAELAQGELVAFLDADDAWLPRKLERQLGVLERGTAMSTTGASVVDAAGVEIDRYVPSTDERDQTGALLTRFMSFGPISSAVVDRTTYRTIGGCSEALQQCADWDLFLRMAARDPIAVVPEPLTVRRVHESNMSRDIDRLATESRLTLDRYFAEHHEDSRRLERRARGATEAMLAGAYFYKGQRKSSARCMLRALRYDPRTAIRPLRAPAAWLGRGGVRPSDAELLNA